MTNKVLIIGNSVGLRIRPPEADRSSNLRFSYFLKQNLNNKNELLEIKNMCKGRHLLEELNEELDFYVRVDPDVIIIIAGVTDACNRDIPLWFSNAITRNRGIVRDVLMYLHQNVLTKYRPLLVRLRGSRPWRSLGYSERQFTKLVNRLWKETSAKIVVLGIMQVDKRVEGLLPGSNRNILMLNSFFKSYIEGLSSASAVFVDLDSLDDLHRPDGIHLDAESHAKLAQYLEPYVASA